jgi:hypothetical protein
MSRDTAKEWGKREAIKVLTEANDQLGLVLRGKDPKAAVAALEARMNTLKKIESPPKTLAETPDNLRKRVLLPGPLRRKIRTLIPRIENIITEIKISMK